MERPAPFVAPPERVADLEPAKQKQRWNFFEMFKKRDEPASLESTPTAEAALGQRQDKRPDVSYIHPEHREFAATVMSLLRGESKRQEAAETSFSGEAVLAAERVTRPHAGEAVAAPEFIPPVQVEQIPFVERAKEMGRGVLRMISRTRDEVTQADGAEPSVNPTDLEPLAVADADVRAAMEELVAPIEALQAPMQSAPGDSIEAAVLSGGDRDPSILFEPKTPLARTLQVAAAVASVTAREVLHAKERALSRTGMARKMGLFALGAATVGGFVYTWNRMRDIKKEQREMRRDHKRFEAEVREAQAKEERRLHELEETNVQRLSQPERQQYVEQVSEFAHKQASEIRTAARTREILYQPTNEAPVEAPLRQTRPVVLYEQPAAAGAPETVAVAAPERPVIGSEKSSIVERLSGVVGGVKGAFGGGIGGAGTIVGATTQAHDPDATQYTKHPQAAQAPTPKRQSSQAWLWGFMLGVSVVVFIVLWGLRIL
ncbi:MAG TPA: hypothetical protein VJM32_00565 [Candidatus Saccharimonadales bacterium]|nr:hypothetical protein [Candidatus Saccharimonadales bacterium]